jgi:hypothetical protein
VETPDVAVVVLPLVVVLLLLVDVSVIVVVTVIGIVTTVVVGTVVVTVCGMVANWVVVGPVTSTVVAGTKTFWPLWNTVCGGTSTLTGRPCTRTTFPLSVIVVTNAAPACVPTMFAVNQPAENSRTSTVKLGIQYRDATSSPSPLGSVKRATRAG